jgi:bifunctional DNA-binding transcriptional regulator/antitoxin component of YhaV-PrlF toxin-antitoxin module
MSDVGEITTVSRASSNFASLRTVIPMSIIKQWKLKEGDKLEWEWQILKGEIVLVVKKVRK